MINWDLWVCSNFSLNETASVFKAPSERGLARNATGGECETTPFAPLIWRVPVFRAAGSFRLAFARHLPLGGRLCHAVLNLFLLYNHSVVKGNKGIDR